MPPINGPWPGHSPQEVPSAQSGEPWRQRLRGEPWRLRVKLCDVYNERALTLLRGSGFVEAYHLLQASLELSLYTKDSAHLTTLERGIGCLPANRGTRLTALTLNNLGVYHRRKGGGRAAFEHLKKAEEIEGEEPAVSTQTNLCAIATELGMLRTALGHLRAVVRHISNEVRTGIEQPVERAAVLAVAAYNLGCTLEAGGALELEEARLVGAPSWCYDAAMEIAHRDLGYDHPVSIAFRDPTLVQKTPRVRLGRTMLGQRVDGSTYSIGWPQFTLKELKEAQEGQETRNKSSKKSLMRSQTEEPMRSSWLAGMGPAPPPPPEYYISSAHLADLTKEERVEVKQPSKEELHRTLGLPPPPSTQVRTTTTTMPGTVAGRTEERGLWSLGETRQGPGIVYVYGSGRAEDISGRVGSGRGD